MSKEEVKKAMTAGYEAATPPSPGEEVENIEAATVPKEAVKEEVAPVEAKEESSSEKIEEPAAPVAKEVKFAEGLFKPYTLGSTLEQGPSGNVMANFKKPAMDYVEAAKNKANQVMTAEDIKNLANKK